MKSLDLAPLRRSQGRSLSPRPMRSSLFAELSPPNAARHNSSRAVLSNRSSDKFGGARTQRGLLTTKLPPIDGVPSPTNGSTSHRALKPKVSPVAALPLSPRHPAVLAPTHNTHTTHNTHNTHTTHTTHTTLLADTHQEAQELTPCKAAQNDPCTDDDVLLQSPEQHTDRLEIVHAQPVSDVCDSMRSSDTSSPSDTVQDLEASVRSLPPAPQPRTSFSSPANKPQENRFANRVSVLDSIMNQCDLVKEKEEPIRRGPRKKSSVPLEQKPLNFLEREREKEKERERLKAEREREKEREKEMQKERERIRQERERHLAQDDLTLLSLPLQTVVPPSVAIHEPPTDVVPTEEGAVLVSSVGSHQQDDVESMLQKEVQSQFKNTALLSFKTVMRTTRRRSQPLLADLDVLMQPQH